MKIENSNKQKSAEFFARRLHNLWGVGYTPCQNGVLIFLASEDREIYISTGSGAAKLLTKQ